MTPHLKHMGVRGSLTLSVLAPSYNTGTGNKLIQWDGEVVLLLGKGIFRITSNKYKSIFPFIVGK